MSEQHPGLEHIARHMAQSKHMPMDRARAILASAARNASPAAKRRNPRLKRVKG